VLKGLVNEKCIFNDITEFYCAHIKSSKSQLMVVLDAE